MKHSGFIHGLVLLPRMTALHMLEAAGLGCVLSPGLTTPIKDDTAEEDQFRVTIRIKTLRCYLPLVINHIIKLTVVLKFLVFQHVPCH